MSEPKDASAAKLESEGNDYNLDVHGGSIGPSVIDVSGLYGSSGQFTYDPGFTSTASCKSSITYIDGEEGVLLHRGYPIEQLAEKAISLRHAICSCMANCQIMMSYRNLNKP